ncbi:MAG TPA: hypothetical protein VL907_00550, partial [Pyrinomonadaceae bacterium]|nr:hypothetical protein [Pyrinomonadaceae bacterium]
GYRQRSSGTRDENQRVITIYVIYRPKRFKRQLRGRVKAAKPAVEVTRMLQVAMFRQALGRPLAELTWFENEY